MNIPTINTTDANLDARVYDVAVDALAAGYRVFAVAPDRRTTGFIWVCKDINGPFVTVGIPSYRFEPLRVSTPIKPSREFGSGVLVGEEDTPTLDAIELGLSSHTVKVRFIDSHPNTVVPNYGRNAMSFWSDSGGVRELV